MRIESYFGLRGAPVCRLRALFLPAPVGGSPLHFARAKVMYSCCASILCMAHDAATCALGVSSLCSSLLSLAHALSSYVAHSSPLVVPRSPIGQHYDVLAFATNVQPAPNAAAATALASSMHRLHSLSTCTQTRRSPAPWLVIVLALCLWSLLRVWCCCAIASPPYLCVSAFPIRFSLT